MTMISPLQNDIMGVMASQINSLSIVYQVAYSGTDQRKYQSSASLAFVRGIHRWPVNSPHKGPVTRKRFPFVSKSTSKIKTIICASMILLILMINTSKIPTKSNIYIYMYNLYNNRNNLMHSDKVIYVSIAGLYTLSVLIVRDMQHESLCCYISFFYIRQLRILQLLAL